MGEDDEVMATTDELLGTARRGVSSRSSPSQRAGQISLSEGLEGMTDEEIDVGRTRWNKFGDEEIKIVLAEWEVVKGYGADTTLTRIDHTTVTDPTRSVLLCLYRFPPFHRISLYSHHTRLIIPETQGGQTVSMLRQRTMSENP